MDYTGGGRDEAISPPDAAGTILWGRAGFIGAWRPVSSIGAVRPIGQLLPDILRQTNRLPMATMRMRCSWALFAASLLLPGAPLHYAQRGSGDLRLGDRRQFPPFIVNPRSLTRPMIWAYVTALSACNLLVLCSSKIRRHIVEGTASANVSMGLALSFLLAISVVAGGPAIVGASVERLLVGLLRVGPVHRDLYRSACGL